MRRVVFIFIVLLLLGIGLFRVVQLYVAPAIVEKRKPAGYTPAEAPLLAPRDLPGLTSVDEEYVKLVDVVMPAVVSITSQRIAQQSATRMSALELLFGGGRGRSQPQVETSLGSGVIVSREGHILTNHHVIAGMSEIQVQLADERAFTATLLGSDPTVDIAVLKISAPDLKPLPLGDSEGVRVGQLVFAIGNPFGLSETVTGGIISAKGRRAMRDSTVEYLQTDAAVNRGNSGGPLINLRGEIVGINTAIYSSNEDGNWLGISFAVPSNIARRALDSVIKRGKIIRGYLGVSLGNLTPELARQLRVDSLQGAVVGDIVAGSPAAKAGLQVGDVIRSFNQRPIKDTSALRSRLNEVEIGERVELGFVRDGAERTTTAEITEAPPEINGFMRTPRGR